MTLPLEVSLFMFSGFIVKKSYPILIHSTHTWYSYYGYLAFEVLTLKTLIGLITLTALIELYPFLNFEANVAAYSIIGLAVAWIVVIIIYKKQIGEYSSRLPILLIQNIILLIAFFINLMLHLKN